MNDRSDPEAELLEIVHGKRVVLFRSGLSDTRRICRRLEAMGIDFTEVEMSMGDAGSRERYRILERMTGWKMLPQIFVDGDFVGGVDEALDHPVFAGMQANGVGALAGQALGYGGLVPFVIGMGLMLFDPSWAPSEAVIPVLAAYAAVTLSFVGAVNWGIALRGVGSPVVYPASVLPALVGWLSLQLAPPVTFSLQAGAFAAVYAFERTTFWQHAFPHWYRRLRVILTMIVCTVLAFTAILAQIRP